MLPLHGDKNRLTKRCSVISHTRCGCKWACKWFTHFVLTVCDHKGLDELWGEGSIHIPENVYISLSQETVSTCLKTATSSLYLKNLLFLNNLWSSPPSWWRVLRNWLSWSPTSTRSEDPKRTPYPLASTQSSCSLKITSCIRMLFVDRAQHLIQSHTRKLNTLDLSTEIYNWTSDFLTRRQLGLHSQTSRDLYCEVCRWHHYHWPH